MKEWPVSRRIIYYFCLLFVLLFSQNLISAAPEYFKIRVIDEETGRGIPLVELRTQSWIRYYTDSNGLVAFCEPGLMDQDLYLYIQSEGYEYPADFLGLRGFVINAAQNDSILVKMHRINIAERLYRITGAGIYHDSFLLGVPAPLQNPLLNGKVLGQDSNLSTIYNHKVFWIWGDTFKPSYPWGNVSISAATSELPVNGGLAPETGVDLAYFVDSTGFSKSMILLAGKGFVWFDWILNLENEQKKEILVAKYARVKTDFTNHERGIAVYNDQTQMFDKYRQVDAWLDEYHVTHHPFHAEIGKKNYVVFTSEFSFSRAEPKLDLLADPAEYESYTCLKAGTKYSKENPNIDRDVHGKLIWDWKKNTDAINLARQKELFAAGKITADEKWLHFQNLAGGEELDFRRGSVFWNNYRQRWILIVQKDIGEIWYSEGDTPTGPWVFAQKLLTHDQYFYNPVHHPFFDQQNGRVIYFEGTYTNIFNANPVIKPRYEYNQLMYRLRLDDPRLNLPVAVYQIGNKESPRSFRLREHLNEITENLTTDFFAYAPDRAQKNLIPIYQHIDSDGSHLSSMPKGKILFYALPAEELPFEKIRGSWRCDMTDGIFLKQDFELRMELLNDQLTAKIENAGYSVLSISATGDTLDLTVHYVDKTYIFQGIIVAGKIAGNWTTPDMSARGTWEAVLNDHIWAPVHSPTISGIYLYTDKQNGSHFYSVEPDLIDKSYIRAEKPVCRVWTNPSRQNSVDFSIIPANPHQNQ